MKGKWIKACALAGALSMMTVALGEQVDLLEVDHRLYELGYRDSACKGELNEVTVNALRNFQQVNGLEVTGEPDSATVSLLMSDAAVDQETYLVSMVQQNMQMQPLSNGSYGEDVARLQRELKELGYFEGNSDGAFGEETKAAVCRFQLANGLKETGIADGAVFLRLYNGAPIAWTDFLNNSCASVGDSGAMVRTLQIWLRRRGYFDGECTGRYGEGTQRAVKKFQSEAGLEATGDMDLNSCRALYSDVNALLQDSSTLRLGDESAEAQALCRDLSALGYPAQTSFDMQTELALMQFQLVNGLAVTGAADAATRAQMRAENVVRLENYVYPETMNLPQQEGLSGRIARNAAALLGQRAGFTSGFGFIQYVYMKCGVPLMDTSQMRIVEWQSGQEIPAGSILWVRAGGRDLCGIATSDEALIYCSSGGFIVMSYLNALEIEAMQIYQVPGVV